MKGYRTAKILFLGYITIILLGTILLLLPLSRRGPLSLIDALFTATSALCVTGLIVKDTANFFTPFGKTVILTLIQIGGIGYMTIATFLLFFVGKKGSLKMRIAMAESYPDLPLGSISQFVKRVIFITLLFETTGSILLFLGFRRYGLPIDKSLFYGVFQSISAFSNAGFSTFNTSLIGFRDNPLIIFVVIILFVVGGMGFIVIEDLFQRFIVRKKHKLLLHTKVVLATTLILIVAGWLFIFVYEYGRGLNGMSLATKSTVSLFQILTPRTAGFTLINLGLFQIASLFLIILFMLIGGSPGGTAGGMKTTSVATLFVWLWSYLRGRESAVLFGYRIPKEALRRSFSILLLSISVITIAVFLLFVTEGRSVKEIGILPYLFEVSSAFGTVGLSLGSKLNPYVSFAGDFSIIGKTIMILTMLIGRIGVLSMVSVIIETKKEPVSFIEGRLTVG